MAPPLPTLWTNQRGLAEILRPYVISRQRIAVAERILPRVRQRREPVAAVTVAGDLSHEFFYHLLQQIAELLEDAHAQPELCSVITFVMSGYSSPLNKEEVWPLCLDWPDGVSLGHLARGLACAPNRELARTLTNNLESLQKSDWETVESWVHKAILGLQIGDDERVRDLGAKIFGWIEAWMLAALIAHASRATLLIGQDLNRPMIAVDAGVEHHAMLSGVRDLPKRGELEAKVKGSYAEIVSPDNQVSVLLNLRDMPSQIVEAIRKWRSWFGLRHWAGVLRLLTNAGRSGEFIWRLEDHLEALGYEERSRRDPAIRKRVADEILALTRMEIAVYNEDRTEVLRGPILTVDLRAERRRENVWDLEGLKLSINKILYRGVRRDDDEIGTLWAPAPVELAQIDHSQFPFAISLGLILSIRWRWDVSEDVDRLVLTGQGLLDAAGIQFDPHNASRQWESLKNNLEELMRIRGLESYAWIHGKPWSLTGRCELVQPQWVRDRMVHRLDFEEASVGPVILTGSQLLNWRKKRGLTQVQLARELGVSRLSVVRAESGKDIELTTRLKRMVDRRVIELEVPGSARPFTRRLTKPE